MADNIADKFEAMVDVAPDRVALVEGDERMTFGDLELCANRFAHVLDGWGIGRDDTVALAARNSVPFVVAFLACFKLRAIPVNVNYRYVGSELLEVLEDSAARVLVADVDVAHACAAALSASTDPSHVVVIGEDLGSLSARATTFRDALAGSSSARDFASRSGDDLHMLYTGGTTGRPKGVVWRHQDTYLLATSGAGLDTSVAAAAPRFTVLPAGPFVHASPQWVLIGSLIAGRTTVVLGQFDPAVVWDVCDREHVQLLAITGDAMARPPLDALGSGRPPPGSIVAISSSGGILSPAVKAELARVLPQAVVMDSIGSTETGLLGTQTVEVGSKPATELRVSANPDTIVVDTSGRPTAPGAEGLLAKAGAIPLRYHNDPAKTAQTFMTHHGRRYAISGDIARVEHDGTITVLGRSSSCINTGGEKVYPNEIEGVLKEHPAVEDCLVVGLSDNRWGQRVAVIVETRAEHAPSLAELQRHARAFLAGYKIPRSLCVVDAIERQPSGKADHAWTTKTVAAGPWHHDTAPTP